MSPQRCGLEQMMKYPKKNLRSGEDSTVEDGLPESREARSRGILAAGIAESLPGRVRVLPDAESLGGC